MQEFMADVFLFLTVEATLWNIQWI